MMKKSELIIFSIIVAVAGFLRFYQLAPSATIISPIFGIITVIGLYLLAREMFEWRVGALAGFLMAVSFWAVVSSRNNPSATMLTFILVFAFYFIWRGLKHGHLSDFFWAGILGGLGFYVNASYYAAPLIAVVLFINYWSYLKKDFSFSKYEHAKNQLLRGFALLVVTAIVVALPIGFYFWRHPGEFIKPAGDLTHLGSNIVKTLGMLNFTGDSNPAHNIPGSPMLPWPVGVLFAIGFINELIHWLKRRHGHWATTHTLMFAWFFIMLIPGFLSANAPDATITIGVLPVVMLFSTRGLWWVFDKLEGWYEIRDVHSKHEAHAVTALVMIIFLFSLGFMEYWRYFNVFLR